MSAEAPTDRQPRTPMSRDRVLREAIRLADTAGIEALTMRRLAREVGVEAMTLYYYVANKDEMVRGMVDAVASEIASPAPGGDWKAELRRSAISAHDVLMRHRWAAALMLSGETTPVRLRHSEAVLRCLREGGFSPEMTHHAYHALESHIYGFTLWLVGMALDPAKLQALAENFLREVPRDEYPHLYEHVGTHLVPSVEYTGSEFEFGLDLILDGLERLRADA
jgi:AcrR family transcriptional regulator